MGEEGQHAVAVLGGRAGHEHRKGQAARGQGKAQHDKVHRPRQAVAQGQVVGIQGLAVASASYLSALEYARERKQGAGSPAQVRKNFVNKLDLFIDAGDLPAEAPEGKYSILTHFLRDDTLVAVTRNDLFVRQSGLIAWLSRLAERHAMTYGGFTVAIALLAGFLAGSLFKGGAKH